MAITHSLRILTVNIHKGFSYFNRRFVLPELRAAVRTVSADMVFMQEVQGEHTLHAQRHSKHWPETPHYEFLADSIWQDYAYGRNAVYPSGHHGNALMSKYPIGDFQNIDVSVGRLEKRGVLHCEVVLPEDTSTLHALCVHFGLRESYRRQQLKLLCDLVETLPIQDPVIVAGDFNDWRCQAHRVMVDCGLSDVFVRDLGTAPKTFPAFYPVFRLDRIYVRGVSNYRPIPLPNRPWAHLSDHAPLAARIVL
ncbi:MAG: endonuclease/exonuclease/phosphatase family protein [Natronospirillum sp.]